jgi:hypothetical protein
MIRSQKSRIMLLVARWPHGCRRKYSEVAVPMLVGFEPREDLEGADGGWWKEESTLFRPPPRGQHGFESRREGCPWVLNVVYVCECEVEWAWVAGESAPEPRRITDRQRNKENELEKRPTERYRKSRMAKNGNGNLKKKKKKSCWLPINCCSFRP